MPCALACLALLALCGCYHVVGSSGALPKGIQTIAVPPFTSNSDQYNAADLFAEAIGNEFTTRTRYRVVTSKSDADAILSGAIDSISTFPTVSDPKTGRATSLGLAVVLNISLIERKTGKILYSHPGFQVRDYYELAEDPHQTYAASGPAFTRMSKTVARDVVASILDDF